MNKINLTHIQDKITTKKNLTLYLARLDQYALPIGGNKRFKLKHNRQEAQKQWKKTLLTFWWAYSNHLRATAIAGKEYHFKTIGIVRGEELVKKELNKNLQFCKDQWMQLTFISRWLYKQLSQEQQTDKKILSKLSEIKTEQELKKSDTYIIPEWWTNSLAIKGCGEIIPLITNNPKRQKILQSSTWPIQISCPIGTAGTIAGIISSLKEHQEEKKINIIGYPAIKTGKEETLSQIEQRTKTKTANLNIVSRKHPYGKISEETKSFIKRFYNKHQIQLDDIYTGPMLEKIYNSDRENETIIAIHTWWIHHKQTSPWT